MGWVSIANLQSQCFYCFLAHDELGYVQDKTLQLCLHGRLLYLKVITSRQGLAHTTAAAMTVHRQNDAVHTDMGCIQNHQESCAQHL